MGKRRGLTTVLSAAVLVAVACQPPAGQKVGPNQHFRGLVNGKNTAAQIKVACPGPAVVGRTTHPLAGQTLAVTQVASGGGFTGSSASAIYTTVTSTLGSVASFKVYDATQPIPTTLTVPCQGTGQIAFSTCFDVIPCTATAKPNVVTVTYVNLAV